MTEIEEAFRSIGIRDFRPGFYDDPAFLEAEKRFPLLLEGYAEYVNGLRHSQEYLDRARDVIVSAATFLESWVSKEGRKGACIDASGTLGRFLEKEGIWNYAVKGGLTIEYASTLRLPPTYFAPIFETKGPVVGARAGHAWIFAPPFRVVDITLRHQPYRDGEERHLPARLFALEATPASRDLHDWIDVDLLRKLTIEQGRPIKLADVPRLIGEQAYEAAMRLGACTVEVPPVKLKYAATGVMAGDLPLEQSENLVLCGHSPIALYEKWREER
jgi:hypothetical protein